MCDLIIDTEFTQTSHYFTYTKTQKPKDYCYPIT